MTKPKILITGNVSPFVMRVLLERWKNDEVELVFDRLEVLPSDYDAIVTDEACLPNLTNEQVEYIMKRAREGNLSVCPDYICDSITLLDANSQQKVASPKTKNIAKHNYPWYHQRSFR